jgi:hypothetical protein
VYTREGNGHSFFGIIMEVVRALNEVDSIGSLFNVLIKSHISKTASFEVKTHVLPIDGSAQGLTNQRSLVGHIQAKARDVF